LIRAQFTPSVPRRSLPALVLLALTVVIGPQFQNITFGQVNVVVLICCVGYWRLTEQDRPVLGGVLLSLGCWLKVFPALLAVVALRDPRYRRALLGLMLGGVVVPLALLPVVPPALYLRYFGAVLPTLSQLTSGQLLNMSIPAVIVRAHMTSMTELLGDEMFPMPLDERVLLAVPVVLMTSWLALVYLRRGTPERRATAAAVVMAIIPVVVPLGWGYTYVLALPLLWLGLVVGLEHGGWWFAVAMTALLAMYAPSHTIFGFLEHYPLTIAKIVYARYPIAVMALVVLALVAPRRSATTIK
jgi:hypothetical protein